MDESTDLNDINNMKKASMNKFNVVEGFRRYKKKNSEDIKNTKDYFKGQAKTTTSAIGKFAKTGNSITDYHAYKNPEGLDDDFEGDGFSESFSDDNDDMEELSMDYDMMSEEEEEDEPVGTSAVIVNDTGASVSASVVATISSLTSTLINVNI